MANGNRSGDHRGFNKGRNSKFREGSRVRQTPEEGQKTYRPKRCENNNKDEDNSPKILNDKNHMLVVFAPSFLCVWNQMLRRKQRFFARTPSKIRRIVRILEVADRFLQKPFRFCPRIFLISEKQNIKNLCSKNYASVILSGSRVTFLGERDDAVFCPFFCCILFIDSVA